MLLNIDIREALPTDAADIRHVQRLTWIATYVNEQYNITVEDIESKNFESVANIQKTEERIKNEPDHKTFVAVADGKIIGFCSVHKGAEICTQGGTYILPEYHRQGIGQKLVNKGFEFLGTTLPVECEVAVFNLNAIAFWKKQDFEESGTSEFKFSNGKTFPLVRLLKKP